MLQDIIPWMIVAAIFGALIWGAYILYNHLRSKYLEVLDKFNNLERVLLDIRDGTKNFYREKRNYPRVQGHISAKLKGSDEILQVDNISYAGAMLQIDQEFKKGDVINLEIFLPIFPQPITAKSQVVNVSAVTEDAAKGRPKFKVGVEFIGMSSSDKDKLAETVAILNKNT